MKNDEVRTEANTEPLRHDGSPRHVVTILSGIYLDAGLPLEAAVRSAVADYECSFERERGSSS